MVITPQSRELIEAAAAPHVTDVRKVLIYHLTPEQLDLIRGLGDQAQARLAALEQEP